MAQLLKKLEDQLKCSICLNTYTNPKQLQCSHVYCQECLVRLVAQDQVSLTCPNCSQVTPVPTSGVAGLQAPLCVNQFLNIVEEHKKAEGIHITCTEHGGKEVALYCETCGETICLNCITKDDKHNNHNYKVLNEAFKQYKEEMSSSLKPMEKQLIIIESSLVPLDRRHSEIKTQSATLKADIQDAMAQLHQTLNVRETELISQLDQLTESKLKSLTAQRDQLETTFAQMNSCLLFMRENLKTSKQAEALQMKSYTVRQVKELTTTFQPDMLEPNAEADMVFSILGDLSLECQSYGHIRVKPTIKKLGTPILTIEGVEKPSGVAVSKKGEVVVVTEAERCCVTVFCPDGERRGSIGSKGSDMGEFECPSGVALDTEENIYVADNHNCQIQKFTSKGKFLAAVGTKGSGKLQFRSLSGLTFNTSNNRVYAVDAENGRIQILNSDLTHHSIFGKVRGKKQFSRPSHIACDRTGNVYVADSGNHCIQVFSPEGNFLRVFGSGPGELTAPVGVAIDSSDRVYVSDSNTHRVCVFTSDGEFVTSFGSEGEGPGQFRGPCGLVVNDSGVVYVCDYKKCCISLFAS